MLCLARLFVLLLAVASLLPAPWMRSSILTMLRVVQHANKIVAITMVLLTAAMAVMLGLALTIIIAAIMMEVAVIMERTAVTVAADVVVVVVVLAMKMTLRLVITAPSTLNLEPSQGLARRKLRISGSGSQLRLAHWFGVLLSERIIKSSLGVPGIEFGAS